MSKNDPRHLWDGMVCTACGCRREPIVGGVRYTPMRGTPVFVKDGAAPKQGVPHRVPKCITKVKLPTFVARHDRVRPNMQLTLSREMHAWLLHASEQAGVSRSRIVEELPRLVETLFAIAEGSHDAPDPRLLAHATLRALFPTRLPPVQGLVPQAVHEG